MDRHQGLPLEFIPEEMQNNSCEQISNTVTWSTDLKDISLGDGARCFFLLTLHSNQINSTVKIENICYLPFL